MGGLVREPRPRLANLLRRLADHIEPKKKMVWKLGCKHGLPNFVHCPECDRKQA